MDKVALLTRLQVKQGKEDEVEEFLRDAKSLVENQSAISTWHALRLNSHTYIILDTFADDEAREAHLSSRVEKELEEKSSGLLSERPTIEKLEVVAVKMPEVIQY